MFEFHKDKIRYFEMQRIVTQDNIIPFISSAMGGVIKHKRVLEIGCAEAGVLKAFIDLGNVGVGVELSASRYDDAKEFLKKEIEEGKFLIINSNIFDIVDPKLRFGELFDIIVLKDVIEHIPEQSKFIDKLKEFLKPDGVIFFAYPPWWMPFGGHQQLCLSKFLAKLPWFHLLPTFVYKYIIKWFGEGEATIKELLEIKSTGIIIESMQKILKKTGYKIIAEQFWFTNPIYRFKFGIKSRMVPDILSRIPYFRNFYTTAHYILFTVR